jgi:hypothetical protein
MVIHTGRRSLFTSTTCTRSGTSLCIYRQVRGVIITIKHRDYDREHIDPGSRADPEKKALFGAAKEIIHLTAHIGTEVVGLQLKDLTNQQKDELGLLIAERSVVFFRDQDLSPQQQKKLSEWYGEIEIHVRCPFEAASHADIE